VSIAVDPELTVDEGHETAHEVEHALHHRFTFPVQAIVHVEPHGRSEAHDATAHHIRDQEARCSPRDASTSIDYSRCWREDSWRRSDGA
jgi:hypothetical protein